MCLDSAYMRKWTCTRAFTEAFWYFAHTPGGYWDIKLVYMCRTRFKNGWLRERPLSQNGGLSERPLTGKTGDFGAKNNTQKKQTYIYFFLNKGLFDLARLEKRNKELFIFKFCVKIFRTSLFPNPMMDLVHIWYDDRYWSKILKVKVTGVFWRSPGRKSSL